MKYSKKSKEISGTKKKEKEMYQRAYGVPD